MIEQARERNVHKGHEAAFTIQEIQSEVSTDLVPVVSQELSLSEALHVARHFASSARRGSEESATPRNLSWSTGNNPMFAANGKTPLPAARGWFIDRPNEDEMFPDDYDLLDAMELLCEQNKAREVVVEHYDKQGRPNRVPCWELYEASLFVVCEGIPSKSEMERDGADRWGVAYGWQPGDNGRSQLRFHCFVKELMDAGYNGVCLVSFSSFSTSRVIAALKAQDYVLRFVDQLRSKAGESEPMPFYSYALPIKCSVKTITAKSAKTDASKEIYYPIPAIPRLSQRDPEAALTYLASMAITEDQACILEYNGRVEQCVEWSVEESRRIARGQMGEEEAMPVNEAPISDVKAPF